MWVGSCFASSTNRSTSAVSPGGNGLSNRAGLVGKDPDLCAEEFKLAAELFEVVEGDVEDGDTIEDLLLAAE